MQIIDFIATIIILTASGALAPGPLFFATISQGTKNGAKSGLIFSISHTIVEFLIIILLALGLLTISEQPFVKIVIGLIGGIVLIIFGLIQIYSTIYKSNEKDIKKISNHHLFLIGLVFTGLNPYFIIWWLTVGAQLIIIALEFAALIGVIFMFICHVWIDYLWLTSVAYFSKKGKNIMSSKWYKPLMIIFGAILIYYGFNFIISAVSR